MKVLVFIDQFERGGAARVTSIMCNGLVSKGYDVTLALNNMTYKVFYPLDKKVRIQTLYCDKKYNGILGILKLNIDYIFKAKKIIRTERPDVIISVLAVPFVHSRIASWGGRIPLIVCDHTSFSRKLSLYYNFVRKYFYRTADVVTILTKRDEKILGKKIPQKVVVYNPLSFPLLQKITHRRKNILCVGRLDVWHVKGFDIIINIWAKLAGKYPDWMLEIAGDGDIQAENYIKKLIFDNNLEGRVNLLGQIKDIVNCYQQSSIFALPSRVEGFPMVLMEAMSQGCASVAFSIEGASKEMILNPDAGFVVEDGDVNSFSEKLELLMNSPVLLREMSNNAIAEVERFSVDNFISQWDSILRSVLLK